MRALWRVIIAGAVLLIPVWASAFDAGTVRINGFLAQGYIDSDKNNFLAETEEGSAQFNEVGLTFSTLVNDRLQLGAQLLSRDQGGQGNNEVKLDWAFADFRYRDGLGLRVGKVKLPLGLYNEGRDSDFLRPTVFLPQSIYDETKRDLLVAYQGAGLYGTLPLAAAGDLDYHLFYGGISVPDDSQLSMALRQNGTFTLRQNLAPVLVPAFSAALGGNAQAQQYVQSVNITNLKVENNYIAGGALTWNTPADGLRLGFSLLRVSNDLSLTLNKSINPTIDPTDPNEVFVPTAISGRLLNASTWVASLEYMLGDVTFAGEYSESKREQLFNGYTAMDATSQSCYGLISYMATDAVTLSLLYDLYYSDKDDKDGKAFAATDPSGTRKDFFSWRRDLAVGLRYDIDISWTLKAEYHLVNGAALFMTTVNDPQDLSEDWSYVAFKASYNF